MRSSPSSVSGFTMVELLVVIAIAGILAAITLPSFTSLTQSQRVRNASFELYSSLVLARSEAIKRNTDATITFAENGKKEFSWVITGFNVDGTVRTIRNQGLIKGIAVKRLAGTGLQVVYRRTGRPAAAGSFQIDATGVSATTQYVRCVSIDLSGMPRIRPGVCT